MQNYLTEAYSIIVNRLFCTVEVLELFVDFPSFLLIRFFEKGLTNSRKRRDILCKYLNNYLIVWVLVLMCLYTRDVSGLGISSSFADCNLFLADILPISTNCKTAIKRKLVRKQLSMLLFEKEKLI